MSVDVSLDQNPAREREKRRYSKSSKREREKEVFKIQQQQERETEMMKSLRLRYNGMVFTRHVRGRGGVNGGGVAFSQKAHVKYEVPSGAGKVKAKEEEEEEVVEAGGRGRRNAGGVKLLDMTPSEMKEFVLENDERAFRSAQIETGIFKKRAATVHDIRGLPATFKTRLEEQNVRVGRSSLLDRVIAKDGTVKLLLGLGADGGVIETVGIPASSGGSKPRVTCCVSSQVGCAMRCAFCATGKMGFTRNLSSGETGITPTLSPRTRARASRNGDASYHHHPQLHTAQCDHLFVRGDGEI